MNNVFAVGGRVTTLTANSNAPSSRLSTTPPSPTAVAINLLNVLKIANTMSHPLFNPFVPGKQSSSQGQYRLSSGQTDRDPRGVLPRLEPGSSYSSGTTPLTLGKSGGPLPPPLALPVNYRPERSRITVDDDIERCLDLNIGRAREEARHQPVNQNVPFINTQRQVFPPSNTEVTSYMTSSALQGHRPSTGDSTSRSLDWLPMFKRAPEDDPSKMYSSASSNFLNSGDGRFNISSEGMCNTQSIPGFGNYDSNVPERSVLPPETSRPKYTSESASNILLQFGLEKEDLEHLITYPEDQITPQNLPFILRQIQLKKSQRTAVPSKPYSEPPPIGSVSGMDKVIGSRGAALPQDEIQSIVLKPSKVIDYGHTGKYTAGIEKDIGIATPKMGGSESLLHMDTFKSSSHSQEQLPEPACQTASKSQPSSSLFCSVHPSRPGLVLIGRNDDSHCSSQSRTQGQASKVKEPVKKQQGQQQVKQQPNQQVHQKQQQQSHQKQQQQSHQKQQQQSHQKQQQQSLQKQQQQQSHQKQQQQQSLQKQQQQQSLQKQQQQQSHQKQQQQKKSNQSQQQQSYQRQQQQSQEKKQWQQWKQQEQVHPRQQKQQPLQPKDLPASRLAPLRSSALVPQPVPSLMDTIPRLFVPPFKEQLPAKVGRSKRVPTQAMMQDYAAATPRVFPHTCSLCNKACTTMKDWLSHQNTALHLENCKGLRTRHPNWDGGTLVLLSASSKDGKPLSSASSQIHHQKSRHDSPSRSHSPHRQRGPEDRREKWFSRSRSGSPRYHRESEDRRQRRSSRSRSPNRHYSSENRRDRRSSRSRSPHGARQSRRSLPRCLSPPYDRPTSSRYRSRSRSYEGRSSPRRSHEHRLPPRRSDDKRSSPRRSHERRSSADKPQRRRSRSSERLAKKLLETPAVQSLSKQSDLETMVKTLAPALLAELNKLKSSSSSSKSSSSSNVARKSSSTKTRSSLQRSEKSSSVKSKVPKDPSPTCVKLSGVHSCVSHSDLNTAVESFGRVKSVVLFRSTQQAAIIFQTKEHADKLRNAKSFKVKGCLVSVFNETTADTNPPTEKAQKTAPQQKCAKSDVSTSITTTSTSTAKVKAPSTSSGAKSTSTGKLVTKAKVLVSKAKGISNKQVAKTVKTGTVDRKKETTTPISKDAQKEPDSDGAKPKAVPTKSENKTNKSEVAPNDAAKAKSQANTTVAQSIEGNKIAKEDKDLASTAETSSTFKPETHPEEVAGLEAVKNEEVCAEAQNLPTVSVTSDDQPDATEETEDKGSALEPKASTSVVESEGEAASPDKLVSGGDLARMELETEATEPMEVESSAESKDQKLTATTKTEPTDDHPETSSVKTSPPKPTDPPQRQQTTFKTDETSVKASSPVQPSTMADSEHDLKIETETLEKKQETAKQTETKHEDPVTAVKTEQEPEPVSNISAPSPAVSVAAETEPKDDAATSQHTATVTVDAPHVPTRTVKVDMERQQQEEKSCVQMETVMSPTTPPPEVLDEGAWPVLQDRTSPVPTTSSGSAFSDSVKAESADTEEEIEKLETEVANESVSPKGSEDVKEEPSPSPVLSAETKSVSAASTATVSVTEPVKFEENAAKIPPMTEDVFKAITSALRKHRLTKGSETKSEDRESVSISKTNPGSAENTHVTAQDDVKEDYSSDLFEMNFEEFVTVDEISEDVDIASMDDGSSLSKQTSKTNSNASPDDKNTSLKTSIDCKISVSSSSSSASVSDKKQNQSSELSKTKSVESPASSGQKAPPSKTESPARGSQSSSTGRSTHSSSAAAAAAIKTSAETRLSHEKEDDPTESAVRKSGHKMSAESDAAKTVESESKIETSEMDSAARGQRLETPTQTQSAEPDFTDGSVKDLKKNKEKENDGRSTEGREYCEENDGILDSLDEKTDEQTNLEENKTKTTGPEKGGSAAADGKVCPEDCSEMKINASIKEPADDKDEDSGVMHVTEVVQSIEKLPVADTADKIQVLDQTSRSMKDGTKGNHEDVCQKSNDDQSLENDRKESSKDFTKQEDLQTLNTADDRTITEGECQKLETLSDQMFKADIGSTEEEEEEYHIIDSVEDQPTPTETESETDKKQQTRKGKTTLTEERPTRSSRSSSRTSKIEDEGKSSKKQDKTVKKYETRTRDSRTVKEKKIDQGTEEMVFEVVDSIEDESVQEPSTTEGPHRKQTRDEKTLASTEVLGQSDKEEETMYKILDSVDDETASDKPAMTRSTRGRSKRAVQKVAEIDTKKDKSRTRRRHTPVRDSPENVGVPPKETAPTRKRDAVVKDTSEEETTYEILDAVEEDVEDDQPTPQKSRRGRPKKRTTKKQTEALKKVGSTTKVAEEEEATYQILDSLEDDQCTTDQTGNTGKSTISVGDRTTTKTRSPKTEEEEEAMYQIVDSVEDDQMATNIGTILPVSSAEETLEQAVSEKGLLQLVDKYDPSADTGMKTSTPSSKKTQKTVLVHLDEVSEEEEDYPDDTAKKGELRRQQRTATEQENEQKERRTREQRSRSRSRGLKEAKDDPSSVKGNSSTAKTVDKPNAATSKSQKSKKSETASKNILVNLDEVSEEEEDYPDDAAETRTLKRRQTSAIEPENEQEERKRRERRSRSSSSRRGGRGETASKTKERNEEEEAEPQEMVTLDEVGDIEAEVTEGELQDLLTLDEIVEEETEKEQQTLEALPLSRENQPVDSSKPETLSTLDEADKEDTKNTPNSIKRKHDDDAEKSQDFVTVDEVVETEEEKEAATTTSRGRPNKRSRQTPVRKSTRGKTGSKEPEEEEEENEEVPPASDDSSSTLKGSADVQLEIQNIEAETASKSDIDTASPELELQSASPDGLNPKECEENEENKKAEVKVGKRKQELFAPEAKRSRSQSPPVTPDFKLPPFNPKSPLGQEFVVPKSGFFCNLCSIFYLNKRTAKEFHCSSQRHYNNLQKHYQKLQRKNSSSGSVSD